MGPNIGASLGSDPGPGKPCLAIHGIRCVVPHAQLFSGVQALERSAGYSFLLSAGALDSFPYGRRHFEPRELEPYRCAERAVSVAAPGVTSGDLALQACKSLLDDLPSIDRDRIGLVMHCHCTLDETVSGTVAGRIQHECGARNALPFGISQQHACAIFPALELARALRQDGEIDGLVLIACSDKWLFPVFRSHGPQAVFGDAGAAVLLELESGVHPSITAIEYLSDPQLNLAYTGRAAEYDTRHVDAAARVIERVLASAGVTTADIDCVIDPNHPLSFVQAVAARAGLPRAAPSVTMPPHAHLSTADALVNLGRTIADSRHSPVGIGLLWEAGLAGDFGACVVRFGARPEIASGALRA